MFEMTTCIKIDKASRRKNTTYTLLDKKGTLTIIKGNVLREKMRDEEIYINNLKLSSDGRIIRVDYQPEKLICIAENKDENRKIVNYTLLDSNRSLSISDAEDIKENLLINEIDIINLYISKHGRLLYKKHELTDIELAVMAFIQVIKEELLKGNTTVITKYKSHEEYVDLEEMKLYIPEYMIFYIEYILGLDLTKRNISRLLKSIVPQALKEIEKRGNILKSETTFCKGIEIENYIVQ